MFDDVGKAVKSAHVRARIVMVLLMIGIALDSLGAVSTFSQIRLLESISRGVMLAPGVAEANDFRQNLLAGLKGLSYFVTAGAFLVWMVRARHNLPLLGARSLEYSPVWTFVGFIIPILSFVRPYQVMDEIWCASDPNREGEQSWKWQNSPASLRWWWGLFLAMSVSGTILMFVTQDKSGESLPRLIHQSWLGMGKNLIDIPAALATIVVIQLVGERQAAGLDRLQAATPPEPATPLLGT